jgi:hypothetical protein
VAVKLSATVVACNAPCQTYATSPGNSAQASRQSARSSFRTLPVRSVADRPVHVADGHVVHLEEHATDVLRWSQVTVDLSGVKEMTTAADLVQRDVANAMSTADGRPMATRLKLVGSTDMHRGFVADFALIEAECRAAASRVSDLVWLEKVDVRTSPVHTKQLISSNEPLSVLQAAFDNVLEDLDAVAELEQELEHLLGRVPSDVQDDELRNLAMPEGLRGLVAEAWDIVAHGLQAKISE